MLRERFAASLGWEVEVVGRGRVMLEAVLGGRQQSLATLYVACILVRMSSKGEMMATATARALVPATTGAAAVAAAGQ